jgi:hypothetical protein
MQKTTLSLSMFVVIALCILALNFSTSASPTIALQPTNDDCGSATNVPSIGGCQRGIRQIIDTTAATTATDDPCISCSVFGVGQNANSVWYSVNIQSPCNILRASTLGNVRGGAYDTILAIWTTPTNVCPTGTFVSNPPTSTCTNDMDVTQVACNDNVSMTVDQSRVGPVFIPGGTTAFIEIAESTGTGPGFGGGTLAVEITAFTR